MGFIIINREDGGVSVTTGVNADADHEKIVRKWESGTVQEDGITPHKVVSWKYVSKDPRPEDRTFRMALVHDCKVDMPKARVIHMARIRAERDKKLKDLDGPHMAVIGTPQESGIQAEKQKLRDLPKNTDPSKAKTPEALKAIWPL